MKAVNCWNGMFGRIKVMSSLFLAVTLVAGCGPSTDSSSDEVTQQRSITKGESGETPTIGSPKSTDAPSGLLQTAPFRGFDEQETGFSATVLELGNVLISKDGVLEISPTPSVTTANDRHPTEWAFRTQLSRMIADGKTTTFGQPEEVYAEGSITRLEYAHEQTEVRYRHSRPGLKQSITISEELDAKSLALEFPIPSGFTLRKSEQHEVVKVFHDDKSTPVFVIEGIETFDAEERSLASRMELSDSHLRYVVDISEATFPVDIDPLMSRSWTPPSSEEESESNYGNSILISVDVDGNGFDDLLVGHVLYGQDSGNTPGDRGRTLLYLSNSQGISNTADWVVEGAQSGERLGASIADAQDVNGDGAEDFVIGGWGFDAAPADSTTGQHGHALLYTGSTNLSPSNTVAENATAMGNPVWEFEGDPGTGFGSPLSNLADFNCDGLLDLAVGAPGAGDSFRGKTFVFLGQSSDPYFSTTSADWSREGVEANDLSPSGLAALNVNGDSLSGNQCSDLLIGVRQGEDTSKPGANHGRAELFLGGPGGLGNTPSWSRTGADGETLGTVETAGDIDGDGNDEAAIGVPGYTSGGERFGEVRIYPGVSSSSGLGDSPIWTKSGTKAGENLGIAIESGDVNGDGNPDLIVGSDRYSVSGNQQQGRVRVYLSNGSSLATMPQWENSPSQSRSRYGFNLASGGDLDDDGRQDLAVGAINYDSGSTTNSGTVFLYSGQPTCSLNGTIYLEGESLDNAVCNDEFDVLQSATCQGGQFQNRMTQDCGPYKCAENPSPNCPTACTEDADCKDGNFCADDPTDSDGDQECLGNRPPTADAGPDQGGFSKNERVRLDGTQSDDPDNDMLSYNWTLVDATCPQAGEMADLAGLQQAINDQDQWDPTSANPQFRAPAPDCEDEELTFELEVSDGNYTVTDETVISYGSCATPPVAVVAGQPASAEWGDTISLDAGGSQPGCGASLEYSWSYMPQEPELETSGSESLSVTLPDVCQEENTTYTFNLTVFDGVQNSEPYQRELFVPANGPCDGGGDVSGSGGCSSTGDNGGPIGGLAAILFAGGLAALRRRRN